MSNTQTAVVADQDVSRIFEQAQHICDEIVGLLQVDVTPKTHRWVTIRALGATHHLASLRTSVTAGNPITFLSVVSSIITDCVPFEEVPEEIAAWASAVRRQGNDLAMYLRRVREPVAHENGRLTSDALYELCYSLLRIASTIEWPATSDA